MKSERILLDIDSQREFLSPGGALYTRPASQVARAIRRLFTWARAERVPVISTVLRTRRDRPGPFSVPVCVEGSHGEQRIPRTLWRDRINFGLRNVTDLPPRVLRQYRQVLIEQRVTDPFANDRFERLVTELGAVTYILCGAGVAHGILQAAVGLRARGVGVIVASDAVAALPGENAEMAVLCMEAKGVVFAPTRLITAPSRRPTTAFRKPATSRR